MLNSVLLFSLFLCASRHTLIIDNAFLIEIKNASFARVHAQESTALKNYKDFSDPRRRRFLNFNEKSSFTSKVTSKAKFFSKTWKPLKNDKQNVENLFFSLTWSRMTH